MCCLLFLAKTSVESGAFSWRQGEPDIPLKRKLSRNEAVGVPSSKKVATGKGLVFSLSAAPPPPHASVAYQLNEKFFGNYFESSGKLGASTIFPQTQVELVKTISLCHFSETKLRTAQNEKEDLEVISDLLMKLDSVRKREEKLSNELLARNQDIEILKSEKESLTNRAAELEQEKPLLKGEAELMRSNGETNGLYHMQRVSGIQWKPIDRFLLSISSSSSALLVGMTRK
ncbi:hypothetical protein Bca4012_063814 [Brassica carinata]